MRNLRLFANVFVVMLILSSVTGHASAESHSTKEDQTKASNQLGIDLLLGLNSSHPRGNVFISPQSLYEALSLLYPGTKGQTRAELAQLLAVPINGLTTSVIDPEEIDPSQDCVHRIANSLWHREDLSLAPAYQAQVESEHFADIYPLDVTAGNAHERVNAWIHENTDGMLDDVVPSLDPATLLLLVNTVYFDGRWLHRFRDDGRPGDFRKPDGTTRELVFMRQRWRDWDYYRGADFEMISLPYRDCPYVMDLILTDTSLPLDEWIQREALREYPAWIDSMTRVFGWITLPKFQMHWNEDLAKPLGNLGLSTLFNPELADLGALFVEEDVRIFLSKALHDTALKVTEEGTIAAAATVLIAETGDPPTDFNLVFDRPFFCTIRDTRDDRLLFLGLVQDPLPCLDQGFSLKERRRMRLESPPVDMALEDGLAYVISEPFGLEIFRIPDNRSWRDSRPPSPVARMALEEAPTDIEVKDRRAFVSLGGKGLATIDARNPDSLSLESVYNLPHSAQHVLLHENTLYVTGDRQLSRIDLDGNMSLGSAMSIPLQCDPEWMAIYEDKLYALDPDSSLVVIELSDPTAPFVTSQVPAPDILCLAAATTGVFLGGYEGLFRLSGGLSFLPMGIPVRDFKYYHPVRMTSWRRELFIQLSPGRLLIMDTDLRRPTLRTPIAMGGEYSGHQNAHRGLAVEDGLAVSMTEFNLWPYEFELNY